METRVHAVFNNYFFWWFDKQSYEYHELINYFMCVYHLSVSVVDNFNGLADGTWRMTHIYVWTMNKIMVIRTVCFIRLRTDVDFTTIFTFTIVHWLSSLFPVVRSTWKLRIP